MPTLHENSQVSQSLQTRAPQRRLADAPVVDMARRGAELKCGAGDLPFLTPNRARS